MINSGGQHWIKHAIASLCQTTPGRAARRSSAPLALDELEGRVVPALLGQELFPADYPTNASIASAPVSANSATWVAAMAAARSNVHVDWGAYTPGSGGDLYSMAYNVVHSKDATNYANVRVYLNNYPNESDISGTDAANGNRPYVLVPMPKANPQGVFIEGDGQNGADPSRLGNNDSHLIVWDADTNTGYEFWQASRPGESSAAASAGIYLNAPIASQWNAANEATWNMNANSFRTLGYTSGDAAGLPIMANVVRPDEVLTAAHGGQSATPVLDHALRFTLPSSLISDQFTYPAVHVASGGGSIPYGTRFRLQNNATVNNLIAQMGPQSQVIAHALQQYGLILADIGTAMYIQGSATAVDTNNVPIVDPTTNKPITWDMNDILGGLQSIPTTYFEAVDLTPRVTSLSSSSGAAGNTITITGSNFTGAAGHLSVLFVPRGNSPPFTTDGQTTNLNPGVIAVNAVTVVDDQHIQVVVPAGSGTVDVQVLSGQLLNDTYNDDSENATAPIFGYGISAAVAGDKFTYSSAPGAPTITTQPTDQTVTAGQLASFTAGASGSPPPTVQWQVSTNGGSTWSDIPGATSATYSFTTTSGQNGETYRAVFTNSAGNATTSAATLTVNTIPAAPSITTQPTDQTVTTGQIASFTAGASGSPTPTVQWQVSTNGGSTWNDIPGATSTTYSFTANTGQTGSQYRAVFTNALGNATTNAATLTVNTAIAPAITAEPTDQTVTAGQVASFTAGASGAPAPTVQWQVSTNGGSTWNDIPGATSATYSFATSAGQSGSEYRAAFTNAAGSATTNPATLTVQQSYLAVGGADGTARLYGADGSTISTVNPIAGYTGLLSVALGDFNGDAVPDFLVAAATPAGVSGLTTNSAGKVFVYDGAAATKGTLTLIHTFTPFTNTAGPAGTTGAYTNGLNIAVGDVDGDGKLDLIAGTRSQVRGLGGAPFGKAEFGRLAVVNAGAAADGSGDTLIGSTLTPFGNGYQKGVVVAAGSLDGGTQDEIAVTRGGPVNSPSAAVQSIKLKVFRFASNSLQELDLTGGGQNPDGSTKQPLAPFTGVTGGTIKRDARLAFTDANGDGKDELVFSAVDPFTTPGSNTVRVVAYNIDTGTGKATVASAGSGPDGSYTVGAGVSASFDAAAESSTGTDVDLALILTPNDSIAGAILYLDPLSGASLAGQFALAVVTGGVSLSGRYGIA